MAAKLYLVAYNTAQFLGWTYLAYQMAAHLAGGGTLDTLYAATATTLQIFQVMTVQCWERTGGVFNSKEAQQSFNNRCVCMHSHSLYRLWRL